jgi:hypothetical protein
MDEQRIKLLYAKLLWALSTSPRHSSWRGGWRLWLARWVARRAGRLAGIAGVRVSRGRVER